MDMAGRERVWAHVWHANRTPEFEILCTLLQNQSAPVEAGWMLEQQWEHVQQPSNGQRGCCQTLLDLLQCIHSPHSCSTRGRCSKQAVLNQLHNEAAAQSHMTYLQDVQAGDTCRVN
jgi:hypothetical protein